MRDREERDAVKVDALDARVGVEDDVEEQVTGLVGSQPHERARHEATDCSSSIHTVVWLVAVELATGAGDAQRCNHQRTTAVTANATNAGSLWLGRGTPVAGLGPARCTRRLERREGDDRCSKPSRSF